MITLDNELILSDENERYSDEAKRVKVKKIYKLIKLIVEDKLSGRSGQC